MNLQQIKKLIRWRQRHNAHTRSQFQIARKENNTSIPVDTNKRRCKSLCTNWSPILSRSLCVQQPDDYWALFASHSRWMRIELERDEEIKPHRQQPTDWLWNSTDIKINAHCNSKCAVESLKWSSGRVLGNAVVHQHTHTPYKQTNGDDLFQKEKNSIPHN